jgi:hypothetical protein
MVAAFGVGRPGGGRGAGLSEPRRTSSVEPEHGCLRFTGAWVERSTVAMPGWCFGSVDGSGALRRVVVSEDLVPGPPDGPA